MNNLYSFTYPDLPIMAHREAILKGLQEHQAIVVQGGTGSGKTTQLPKFLVESGMFEKGIIGVTQPRRIAALSITDRLREETGIRELVGAKIRFHEDVPKAAKIKVMTDGILLQEFRRDAKMRQYSCIILDEAHERSLNVDILLGIFRGLLLERPDFRLVVTSATLDADRFAAFLGSEKNPVPVIEVEGRQFPVSLEYWDLSGKENLNSDVAGASQNISDENEEGEPTRAFPPLEAAAIAIRELQARRPDHLLAFLPTEKEIHELHRELEKDLGQRFSILPLYGRLSPGDQKKVFAESGKTKIILATNIAETSLTIPGIGYVVDLGLARISRYHPHTKIQGLPIERISKASAKQRAGRAGRVKAGVCVRLYSETDFNEREEFTEPEILRSNLANVVLQLLFLNLPVETFPFPDAPSPAALKGAFRQLHELGAVSEPTLDATLTQVGRELSQLPVDVTIGKILLTATKLNVLQPALILAAGITVQDPRITPREEPERGEAVGLHRRFEDPKSDFKGILALWAWVHRNWGETFSQRKLRVLCEDNYISFNRMREWIELTDQFCRLLKVTLDPAAITPEKMNSDDFHKAILSGFLPFLARKKNEDIAYRLAGDKEAFMHPGSGLAKKKPEWIVATEIRQTSRVFIFRACEIKPAWIEELVPEACKKSYVNITWNGERGFVEALERVSYKGFPIRQDRRVNYESIAPEECAEIFWREGVVRENARVEGVARNEGVRESSALGFSFIKKNQKTLEALSALEKKARVRTFLPDETTLTQWYRSHAPEVTSKLRLEKYLQSAGEGALEFSVETWLQPLNKNEWEGWLTGSSEKPSILNLFPDTLEVGDFRYPVQYQFDYGTLLDGISIELDPRGIGLLSWKNVLQGLPSWRKWVLDFLLERVGNKTAQEIRQRISEVLPAWNEKLVSHQNLIFSFLETLQALKISIPPTQNLFPTVWPAYTQIHVFVLSENGRKFLIHLDPSMGENELFSSVQKILFGDVTQRLPWKEWSKIAQANFGTLPKPLIYKDSHFGCNPFSSPRFFLDSREAQFYHELAIRLTKPFTTESQAMSQIVQLVQQKIQQFQIRWKVSPKYLQAMTEVENQLIEIIIPQYYLINENFELSQVANELEQSKISTSVKMNTPVKTLADLNKIGVHNSELTSTLAMGLCLGAGLVSKDCLLFWLHFLSPTSAGTKKVLEEILKQTVMSNVDSEIYKSPFYLAWLAQTWQFYASNSVQVGDEVFLHFDQRSKKSESIRKSTKGIRDQFCLQIGKLGLTVNGLPPEIKQALSQLDQPVLITQKLSSILDLDLFAHKMKIKFAGRELGEKSGGQEKPERKDQEIKVLSNRFKKL